MKGYRQTPHDLANDDRVSRPARDLWALLDDLARTALAVETTAPLLCAQLGCSQKSLRRWRLELVSAGWLAYQPSPGGRGTTSRWEPLRRTRRVTGKPVDNHGETRSQRGETRSPVTASDQGNPVTGDLVSRGPYKEYAREEVQEARAPRGPSWCGCCDVTTRHREMPDGRPYRCPECHPLLAPLF